MTPRASELSSRDTGHGGRRDAGDTHSKRTAYGLGRPSGLHGSVKPVDGAGGGLRLGLHRQGRLARGREPAKKWGHTTVPISQKTGVPTWRDSTVR